MAPLLLTLFVVTAPSAMAQTTTTIANVIPMIFGGAGVTAVYPGYSNAPVAFTLTGGTDPVDLAVTVIGSPSGVTAGFVPPTLVPNSAGNISTLLTVTTSTNVFLSVSVVSATKGSYPLQITASNQVTTVVVTNSLTALVLSDVFLAGSATDTNWSTAANWSVGSAPVAGDSARFQLTTNASFDTSIVLDSLQLMPRSSGLTLTNFFAPGVTVAVKGTNGFYAGVDNFAGTAANQLLNFNLSGAGALVVTNPTAPFSMYNLIYQNNVGGRQDMSGLDRLIVDVSRFGVGDAYLVYPKLTGTQPAEMGQFLLAKTNVIRSTYVGDYSGSGIIMTNSISFMSSAANAAGTGVPFVYLGYSNYFAADSMALFSQQSGVDAGIVAFNPAFTNGFVPIAIFRGTNGGRMSYWGAGVESGGSGGANGGQFTARTRGQGGFFNNGKVDMLVDTLVLSQSETNRSGNYAQGLLTYNYGNVDARVVRLGYRAPSSFDPGATLTGVRATLTVGGAGSNATMTVSDSMRFNEGHFTETASGSSFARLVVGNGGKVFVNTITWGTNLSGAPNPPAGSSISVNNGGQLYLTNSMCQIETPMPTLTVQATGQLYFRAIFGQTNACVTTLSDSSGAKIFVDLSGGGFSPTVPATNVLIHYATATGAGSHPIDLGAIPPGYNNVSVFDNATSQNIELRIQTNAPQMLVWKGYVNNVWDHNTANWQKLPGNTQVKFFDNDTVIFADTNSPNFRAINVAETVLPDSIYMSNSASAYEFDGTGPIGGNVLTKQGTAAFTNNTDNGSVVQLQAGALYGAVTLGGVTVFTNTVMSFDGSITAGLTVNSGGQATLLTNSIVNGPVSNSGVLTNKGIIQGGSLSVNGSGFLLNDASGTLKNIGNSGSGNVASGATLLNIGNIGAASQANSLTVNGTFKDMGVSTIYLTTATFNSGATFLPGGDGIGITSVLNPGVGSSFPGRLTMLAGSTTLIKVNFANAQTNTIVQAQYTDFGGNTSVKAYDGCTILVSNANPGAGLLGVGQNFRMFRNSDSGILSGSIGNEGLNTTNRYPIVQPIIPAANTKWDLTNLRDPDTNGFIGIISFPTTGTNLTQDTFISDGTNVVTHLTWPSSYTGWRVEEQTNTLNVGLVTNLSAWTTVPGSSSANEVYVTNSISVPTAFFRMAYP